MALIQVLDSATIDQIAAGEVVEKPANIVKELVENAIDAGAKAITVEIKEGGLSFMRVTDNGKGIASKEVETAFLRHATSKIQTAKDLEGIQTLGFRGEALASIAAVAMVEMVTKVPEDLTGTRYVIEGGVPKEKEEIGAPDGTTIMVRNIFYNVPARKKFLKKPATEASYIADLMEHLALSHPQISFRYIQNNQVKFSTPGNGDLQEVIYRIFGREFSTHLQEISFCAEDLGLEVKGYIGEPMLSRANRNYEIFFVNERYIKSELFSKALEEGFQQDMMQHRFPVCVLHLYFLPGYVDVNVHPTKMEVRINKGEEVYAAFVRAVKEALAGKESIPEVKLVEEPKETAEERKLQQQQKLPEIFEVNRISQAHRVEEPTVPSFTKPAPTYEQMSVFEVAPRILSSESRKQFRIIGQVFLTYWLVEYQNELLILDQHAAHEKIKYERLMKQLSLQNVPSQMLLPPVVVTLSKIEEAIYLRYQSQFADLGFVVEEFGGNEYTLRGVPLELYGEQPEAMFLAILEKLSEDGIKKETEAMGERLASMACKSAVKGNNSLQQKEVETLLDELLTLDNPYHCPHGRPTMIRMSKTELEKKFKRIV